MQRVYATKSQSGACAVLALLLFLALSCSTAAAEEDAAAQIRAALAQWTEDFNAGQADKICDLFAQDARADVLGAPERDYVAICDLLTRSLQDKTRHYSYAMDVKEVLVFGDVAVVRLVWTLTIKEKDGSTATSVEPGMDIFRKQPDGSWKIIRYMAYER
jgi:steroid delta-isomerase